jgi:hypothetical protein
MTCPVLPESDTELSLAYIPYFSGIPIDYILSNEPSIWRTRMPKYVGTRRSCLSTGLIEFTYDGLLGSFLLDRAHLLLALLDISAYTAFICSNFLMLVKVLSSILQAVV